MPFDATPVTNDTIEKLQAMYQKLAKRGGWIKGQMNNGRGGYCLLGAAESVGIPIFEHNTPTPVADSILGSCLPDRYSIVEFNDQKGRKKHEVLALIQAAIDREKAKLLGVTR